MSGILEFHDITYKLLGSILRLGFSGVKWTTKTLTSEVIKGLDATLLADIVDIKKDPEKEVRRLVYYSKKKGYLDSEYETTKLGQRKLISLSFTKLDMDKPWDKKWRVLIFDIPEEKRSLRYHIRRLIKQMEFIQLQQSVWIHPLPCSDEFDSIKEAYSADDALILLEVMHQPAFDKYFEVFREKYPKLKK